MAPVRPGGADTYMARAMSAVAAFLGKGEKGHQKVQAFMTLVSADTEGQQKRRQNGQFTAEENQQYIKKLHEQNRELLAQLKIICGD
jgi:hypothetical protein